MGAEIAFAALWLVSIPLMSWILVAGVTFLGALLGDSRDNDFGGAAIGLFVGWALSVGWFIFAVVKIVLHVVEVIRLI